MDIYNSYSIKARIAVTKQNRQGYLFMPRGFEGHHIKDLNRKIDTLDRQEARIPYFRKNPTYGSHIFQCCECGKERIYGQALAEPSTTLVFIQCEGICKANTRHGFVRVHRGREEREI